MAQATLVLNLRTQGLRTDSRRRATWQATSVRTELNAAHTALLLCDVWDSHWCRGAVERLEDMLPRMNAVVHAVRDRGALIIHAPSDTMEYYADSPGRKRILQMPLLPPPPEIDHRDPPLPVDASDGGSDTGETYRGDYPWTRQHPGIAIDDAQDVISADGREIYSYLQHAKIRRLLICGVHTNMCVLHRSFGIKQMVRWGVQPILIRDLTDTMYNPAMPPYVSHEAGTRLVVEYIEKFWCPSIEAAELVRST